MLSRIAAAGLLLAIASGALFRAKMVLMILGVVHVLALHCRAGFPDGVSRARRRVAGAISLLLWPVVLVCGRMLGYV